MANESSVLIGSVSVWADRTVTITPDAGSPSAETITASLTGLYLAHNTPALSGIAQLEQALTDALVTTPSVYITKAGYTRIVAGANFTLAWTDPEAADFFGFDGTTLSGASAYTSDTPSPYIWAAGRGASPLEAPYGVDGAQNYLRAYTESPNGNATVLDLGDTTTTNTLSWVYVVKARYRTDSGLNGEFATFYGQVLHPGARFLHVEATDVVEGSTAEMDVSTYLGPYKMRGTAEKAPFERPLPADTYFNVQIPVIKTSSDYT